MRWPHHSCRDIHQSLMLSSHLRQHCPQHLRRQGDLRAAAPGPAPPPTPRTAPHFLRPRAAGDARGRHLFQSLCAEGGLMPKERPLTASCGDGAQAALARAAISPHPTHLPRHPAAAHNRAVLSCRRHTHRAVAAGPRGCVQTHDLRLEIWGDRWLSRSPQPRSPGSAFQHCHLSKSQRCHAAKRHIPIRSGIHRIEWFRNAGLGACTRAD